jgi:hypothetical protein
MNAVANVLWKATALGLRAGCFNIGTVVGLACTPPLATSMPWHSAFALQGATLAGLLAVCFFACRSIMLRAWVGRILDIDAEDILQAAVSSEAKGERRNGASGTLAIASLKTDASMEDGRGLHVTPEGGAPSRQVAGDALTQSQHHGGTHTKAHQPGVVHTKAQIQSMSTRSPVTEANLCIPKAETFSSRGAAEPLAEAAQGTNKVMTEGAQRGRRRRWLSIGSLIWAHSAIGWGFFTFQHWIPTYLKTFEITSPAVLGALSALPWAVTAACSFVVGHLFSRLRTRGIALFAAQTLAHTCACLGASAALLPMLLWPTCGAAVSIACIGAAMALQTCNYSGFHAYVQTFGAGRAGAILGVTNSCGIVAGLVANEYLGNGVAVTGSYALMFSTTAAVYASSWAVWMLCLRGVPLDV